MEEHIEVPSHMTMGEQIMNDLMSSHEALDKLIMQRGWDMSIPDILIEHIACDADARVILDKIEADEFKLDVEKNKSRHYRERARLSREKANYYSSNHDDDSLYRTPSEENYNG